MVIYGNYQGEMPGVVTTVSTDYGPGVVEYQVRTELQSIRQNFSSIMTDDECEEILDTLDKIEKMVERGVEIWNEERLEFEKADAKMDCDYDPEVQGWLADMGVQRRIDKALKDGMVVNVRMQSGNRMELTIEMEEPWTEI